MRSREQVATLDKCTTQRSSGVPLYDREETLQSPQALVRRFQFETDVRYNTCDTATRNEDENPTFFHLTLTHAHIRFILRCSNLQI